MDALEKFGEHERTVGVKVKLLECDFSGSSGKVVGRKLKTRKSTQRCATVFPAAWNIQPWSITPRKLLIFRFWVANLVIIWMELLPGNISFFAYYACYLVDPTYVRTDFEICWSSSIFCLVFSKNFDFWIHSNQNYHLFFLLGLVSSTVLNSIELVWLKDELF